MHPDTSVKIQYEAGALAPNSRQVKNNYIFLEQVVKCTQVMYNQYLCNLQHLYQNYKFWEAIFLPPQFDHVYLFIQILLGSNSKAPFSTWRRSFVQPYVNTYSKSYDT